YGNAVLLSAARRPPPGEAARAAEGLADGSEPSCLAKTARGRRAWESPRVTGRPAAVRHRESVRRGAAKGRPPIRPVTGARTPRSAGDRVPTARGAEERRSHRIN